jgi:hypothetical protein
MSRTGRVSCLRRAMTIPPRRHDGLAIESEIAHWSRDGLNESRGASASQRAPVPVRQSLRAQSLTAPHLKQYGNRSAHRTGQVRRGAPARRRGVQTLPTRRAAHGRDRTSPARSACEAALRADPSRCPAGAREGASRGSFSRRGSEEPDESSDDGTTPTKPPAPRQATPATANPGLAVPLAISEDDLVIVDNGPSGLAIGRVRAVGEELVEVHWFSCKDMSVPTPHRI